MSTRTALALGLLAAIAGPPASAITDDRHRDRLMRKAPPSSKPTTSEIRREVNALGEDVKRLADMLNRTLKVCADNNRQAAKKASIAKLNATGCADLSNECQNMPHRPWVRKYCPVTCGSCEEDIKGEVPACRDDNEEAVREQAKLGTTIEGCLDLQNECKNKERGEAIRTLCPRTCSACPQEAEDGKPTPSPGQIKDNPQDPLGSRNKSKNATNTTGDVDGANADSEAKKQEKLLKAAAGWVTFYIIATLIAAKVYDRTRLTKEWPQNDNIEGTVVDPYAFGYGMFKCGEDRSLCLWSFFCLPVRWADTMSKTEPPLAPYWRSAIIGAFCCALNTFPSCLPACFFVPQRQKLREVLGIKTGGSTVCDDFCGYVWCAPCLVAQEARQVEHMRTTVWKKEEEGAEKPEEEPGAVDAAADPAALDAAGGEGEPPPAETMEPANG